MKNSDKPINAIQFYDESNNIATHLGLTKREAFAMAAMSAWIQHHGTKNDYGYSDTNTAKCAVDAADALLAELEK